MPATQVTVKLFKDGQPIATGTLQFPNDTDIFPFELSLNQNLPYRIHLDAR